MAEQEQKPAKKKGGCLKWFLIIFGVIILLGACGAILGGGGEEGTDTGDEEAATEEPSEEQSTEEAEPQEEDTSDSEETTEETEESAPGEEEVVEEEEAEEVVGVGETLTVDDIDFTVNEWYQQDSVGDEIIGSTANDTYLILDVTVTNNQSEALMMMNDFFNIVIGETTYSPDGAASTTANQAISPDNLGLLGEELNPGSSRNALIVYDVTQDVIDNGDKQLQVQSGLFGTQTGIINLQ